MQRINLGKVAPELYKTVLELENLSMQKVQQAGLEIGFSHLLKLRASQINQCAFCVRMHTQDAMKAGESMERIALISAWQESGYFSEKERAALILIEEIHSLPSNISPTRRIKKQQKSYPMQKLPLLNGSRL